ncbi:hypothetical protein GIB67_001636 [Kingdonia uniflora]|uniref:Uncharacterized protein n=1 Tax=Kingdonia uniflora TaxID=39325 RepID=A0A7J7L0W7_9MAGN|nr:hypothetical protein GIB67_001636 [Kingdonia uniflora]
MRTTQTSSSSSKSTSRSAASSSSSSSSSTSSSSPVSSNRGSLKSPWSLRKRKHAVTLQQWRNLFTPDGKFRDAGLKFLKKARSGVSFIHFYFAICICYCYGGSHCSYSECRVLIQTLGKRFGHSFLECKYFSNLAYCFLISRMYVISIAYLIRTICQSFFTFQFNH